MQPQRRSTAASGGTGGAAAVARRRRHTAASKAAAINFSIFRSQLSDLQPYFHDLFIRSHVVLAIVVVAWLVGWRTAGPGATASTTGSGFLSLPVSCATGYHLLLVQPIIICLFLVQPRVARALNWSAAGVLSRVSTGVVHLLFAAVWVSIASHVVSHGIECRAESGGTVWPIVAMTCAVAGGVLLHMPTVALWAVVLTSPASGDGGRDAYDKRS